MEVLGNKDFVCIIVTKQGKSKIISDVVISCLSYGEGISIIIIYFFFRVLCKMKCFLE
jgi:hypothetical protein